jgi:ribosomal protein S18 acetylase RimI-like enzyme
MIIRPIQAADLPELFDLRARTRENPYTREALREIGITEEITASVLKTTHRGWLCEIDGLKTGFAIGDGSTGELCVIAMLPDYEGRGIGSRLLGEVEAWLSSIGWKEFWLWTSADTKKRAFGFYTRHGWTVNKNKGDIIYMKKVSNRRTEPTIAAGMRPADQP